MKRARLIFLFASALSVTSAFAEITLVREGKAVIWTPAVSK